MNCLRCQAPTLYQGTRRFLDGKTWDFLSDLSSQDSKRDSFDVYACPNCGKVEFFITGHREQYRTLISAPDGVELSPTRDATDIDQLLKITPDESTLKDIREKLGGSTHFRRTRRGLFLYFATSSTGIDHFILLNEAKDIVELVAVYNEADTFLLEDLERQFGDREMVGVIEGNEHWYFVDQQVTFVSEGRNDHNISYVMFLSKKIDFDRYFSADGYSDAFAHQN